MQKREVVLFQPFLRQFVLNFGLYLKGFTFVNLAPSIISGGGFSGRNDYNREIRRRKTSRFNRLRRLLGAPNIRIRNDERGDLYFTYGCLLITRKPYCVYIENGLALYNYDLGIAKNPIARLLVSYLATRKTCSQLIFVSQASYKSFYSTVRYSPRIKKKLLAKSRVIYPVPIKSIGSQPKTASKTLKLLFVGLFYIKGGKEVARAFERLRKRYGERVELTIVTALSLISHEDRAYLEKVQGLTLLEANLNEQAMIDTYRNHHVFLLPTMREGFGLVLIEAIAYGMPIIITDQYATSEMARAGKNGFVYPNHPMKDYDPRTMRLLGKYYDPNDFYTQLFALQSAGKLKPLEDFLVKSVSVFINNPKKLEEMSHNSLELYKEVFEPRKLGAQIEEVFSAALPGTREA